MACLPFTTGAFRRPKLCRVRCEEVRRGRASCSSKHGVQPGAIRPPVRSSAASYERQRDRLREELTLAQIDHHAEAVDELVYTASWPSQNAFCQGPQTYGCRRLWTTSSGCSSCSFRMGLRTTEFDSIEPP